MVQKLFSAAIDWRTFRLVAVSNAFAVLPAELGFVPEELVPIFRLSDALQSAKWYARLGFVIEGEHRFAPALPLYLFLRRGQIALHLSEHKGDAQPNTLVYFYVHDVDRIAAEFEVAVKAQPWAREVSLTDPDGNRLRIGERKV